MPIPGMTDRQPAFPRVGVLRKGAPKPKNSKAPGKDLTYFRFVTDDPDAMDAFRAAYGPNPARIKVMLPFATTDQNFEAWMEEWVAGGLVHRCDGHTCVLWQDDNGQYQYSPKPCPGRCKPTGRLMVIIPDLVRLAYVQVLTTSKHDIVELSSNLRAAEETARFMGRDLRGIDFILTRVPREISTPPREEGGKRIRAEKWLLHIEPAPSWVARQIEAAKQLANPLLTGPADIPAPNGDEEDDDRPDGPVVDHETGEIVEPDPGSDNGNGRRYYREDFVARIQELMTEAEVLGQPINIDQGVLDEASMDDLKTMGTELRQHVDNLRANLAEQETLPL